ncbi:hypothetical protein BG006_000162 [Podila minutissima]|uniref:Uncharacterized protein n=1 Tax=Podila minutissima TaxID=64525 RepID=A0A9P5VHG1_9FUNG|nr:hypothetical protein BG006_000162 [Podila minutissima]
MLSRETYSGRRDHTIARNSITSGTSTSTSQVEGVKKEYEDYDSLPSSSSDIYTYASRNHPQHRPTDGLVADQITSSSSYSALRSIKSQNRVQPEEMDPYDFKLQKHLQKNGIAHKPLSNHRRQHDFEGQDRTSRPRSKETFGADDPYQLDSSKRRERKERGELSSSKLHSSQASQGIDHRNKSLQRSIRGGEPLTIRDIIDNREIRNEINELRLSTGSSRAYPSPSSPSQKRGAIQNQSGAGQRESSARKPSKSHRDGDSARDFSIDQSILEKKFRSKLDAVIDVQQLSFDTRQTRSPVSQDQERRDRADSFPYPRSPATQRRQRDLYHSSYSPSDFSQTGENDDDDEERTVELKPGQLGIISSTPVQVQAPLLIQTEPIAPSKSKRSKKHPKDTNAAPATRPEDVGYDSAEGISFEREVAIAKAKRELGASINGPGPSSAPTRQQPDRPMSSKLDHGRSLELGDLVSPTSYKFGGQGGGHNNLITRPAPPPSTGLPLPSAAPLPLNITGGLTRVDTQRFMELAGALGEGQGMIRDLKAERKKSNATIKLLQKDLKKTNRELNKANESKERLSKALSKSTSSRKSNGDNRRLGSGSILENSEQERIHAGIQRERDQVEKNLVMLQQRIAAQEQQMAEMHARDKVRIQQEEHLMELIDTESEEETEEESEDEDEDDEDKVLDHGDFRDDHNRDGGPADENIEPTKQRKGWKDDGAGVLKSSRIGKRPSKSTRTTAKRDKIRQALPDSRRMDKVEEVHIHHHVHYSDEEDEAYYEIRPRHTDQYSTMRSNTRYNYPDDHRSHFVPRQSYRAPPGTIQIPVRDIMSQSYPGQRSRYPLYDDDDQHYQAPPPRFRRSQGHSVTRGFAGNSRARAFEEEERLQREVGARRAEAVQQTETATSASTQTEAETRVAQPQQSPQTQPQPSLPSQHPPETAPQADHRTFPVNIPLAPKATQKKLSIDIQRILSLLKTHDPTRCTVCQSGESHHHQHSGLRIDGRPIVVRRKKPMPEAARSANGAPDNSSPKETSRHKPEIVVVRSTATSLHDMMDESSYDTSSKPHGGGDDTDNDDNDDHPEQRLHEALQLLEEEVRELRASYLDLTEDLEVLTLETELLRKRQQIPEAKRSTSSASSQAVVDNDLESLNRKKQQIQEQLRKVIDCLEEKADLVMVLQEQGLQEQHNKQQDSRELQN